MRKKLLMLLVLGLIGIGIVGCDETENTETEKTTKTTKSTEEKKNTETTEEEKKKTTEATEEEEKKSDNPLLNAEIIVNDVGGTVEKDAKYAIVYMDIDVMKNITMEQYDEFCETVVNDSGYNWVTIDFQDGTGLAFSSSQSLVATYGEIDEKGRCRETIGDVIKIDEGKYEYEEKSN